jgi:hypothetical protein
MGIGGTSNLLACHVFQAEAQQQAKSPQGFGLAGFFSSNSA